MAKIDIPLGTKPEDTPFWKWLDATFSAPEDMTVDLGMEVLSAYIAAESIDPCHANLDILEFLGSLYWFQNYNPSRTHGDPYWLLLRRQWDREVALWQTRGDNE